MCTIMCVGLLDGSWCCVVCVAGAARWYVRPVLLVVVFGWDWVWRPSQQWCVHGIWWQSFHCKVSIGSQRESFSVQCPGSLSRWFCQRQQQHMYAMQQGLELPAGGHSFVACVHGPVWAFIQ